MFSTAETARNTSGTAELPRARSSEAKKLYKKVAAMPQKITTRYSRMTPRTPAGTFKKAMIQSTPAKAARHSAAASAAISTKAAQMPSSRAAWSRWPNRMENTAPLPMHSPSRIEVKKVIRVKAEPTAASASGPKKRPTIRVSATL